MMSTQAAIGRPGCCTWRATCIGAGFTDARGRPGGRRPLRPGHPGGAVPVGSGVGRAARRGARRLLDRVDLLFANEQEACGLTGPGDAEAAAVALARRCSTVAVTRGARGSVVAGW